MDLVTDWENVEQWYGKLVGKEGHYYHQHVILPLLLPLLEFQSFHAPSLLDLGCGQGILSRAIPSHIPYWGVDLAPSLIKQAKKGAPSHHQFFVSDISQALPIKKKDFTHATIILALQNVSAADRVIFQAASHLQDGGLLAIVLNHPCFRIPRQSSWGVDSSKKLQYRRIDSYLTPQKIPIQMHPGQGASSKTTFSFHHSLSDLSRFLSQAGLAIILMDEWTSDKKSTGPLGKMENRARKEFPLFLTFLAQKIC